MRDIAWLRLKKKEQVAVLLRLLIVGKETFLKVRRILKVTCDLILLPRMSAKGTWIIDREPVLLPMPFGSGSVRRSVNRGI